VNAQNKVTTPAFTYDAAGNVTSDTTVAMTYDAEGRMTPTSGTTYTYDGDGRRVQKSDGTVYWMDNSLRPLSVGTTSGSITRDYIFLGGKRIAFVPLSSGNPYYYLSDHLGSTAVVASGDGKTIQWEADYFPFGSQRQVFTNIASNNYEFTGYEYDSDTGYNYANARFDAGRWGRFLSPDPFLGSMGITNPQSLNRYSYVSNDPTNAVDPSGLCANLIGDGCEFAIENPTPNEYGHFLIGGGGGGLGDILGGILGALNGGGFGGNSISDNCFLPGTCPSLKVPGVGDLLPKTPSIQCPEFGPCAATPGLGIQSQSGAVVAGGVVLEGLCILFEPCGAIELIDIGIAGTVAAAIALLSDRNQGNVAHPYVRDMARSMGGDYCTALKAIRDQARKSGNSKLFNDAKATYKQDCRGK
jgi:RHS repeat-associated protein